MDSESLRKKARKKYLSNSLAAALVKVGGSPLTKKYATTFACCHQLSIAPVSGEMSSNFYCKNRWCSTCASIKMATMINKYGTVIRELPELQFVTLTVRTVKRGDVGDRMDFLSDNWRKVSDLARKKRQGFRGLRKTELKVGEGGGYHGHYHLLMSGAGNAAWTVDEWLRLTKGYSSYKGQDISPVEPDRIDSALLELFKYATKNPAAEDSDNKIKATAPQMDTIFRALHGRRLYQPFGGLKGFNEDDFELDRETVQKAAGLYEWIGHDWFHVDYGQALSNYVPDPEEIQMW